MPATLRDRRCSGRDTTVQMDRLKSSPEQRMNWKASVPWFSRTLCFAYVHNLIQSILLDAKHFLSHALNLHCGTAQYSGTSDKGHSE